MAEAMVVGAGAWGTALALVLARSGHQVWLWARPETAAYVEQRRESPKLPGIALPESVRPTAEVRHAKQAALIVYALPCAALAQRMPALPLPSDAPVVVATKGIDPETGLRADELARRYAPESPIALLSGPSFAREVAEGKPTAIVLAAESLALAQQAAGFFSDRAFRIYFSDDPAGVAIAGALKNVIAIAAGAAEGLGLGHNAVAALITRGLAEIARLAAQMGAHAHTVMGLAGLGDLVLTATGKLSRNRRLGMLLAQGSGLAEAEAEVGLAEGVRTAIAARRLARSLKVEAPIIETVAEVVAGNLRVAEAVEKLLQRPEKPEWA